MRLSDIDKDLVEAPVGMLRRAATKLKKQTPFSSGARARAEGRDVLEKAVNDVALSWQTYVGKAGVDKDAVSAEQLLSFLKGEGYLKTGKKVINTAIEQKTKVKPNTKPDESNREEQSEEDVRKAYSDYFSDLTSESLESRLAYILYENENQSVTFTNKEVEQILFAIIKKIHQENPKGLDRKINDENDKVQDDNEDVDDNKEDKFITGLKTVVDKTSLKNKEKEQLYKGILNAINQYSN